MKVKNLLVFLMSAALSSVSVDVLASVEVDGICYNILSEVGKTVEVTENPAGYSGDIVIPNQAIIEGESYMVTAIGDYAFEGCRKLTSIGLPAKLSAIGEYAFADCTALAYMEIPENVQFIGMRAFSGCTGLTSVKIPDSAAGVNMGIFVFEDCTGLTSIELPNWVYALPNGTFSGCTGLASVSLPDGLHIIDDHAFSDCTALMSIELPASLTEIGMAAFQGCGLASVEIPDNVTLIEEGAFQECGNLVSAVLPSGLETLGNFIFSKCGRLSSIEIPKSVTSIGIYTFFSCGSLTSIDIPENVTSIGDNVFTACNSLTEIRSKNPTPPEASRNTFDDYHYTDCALIVPEGSLDKYSTAAVWCNFVNMDEADFGGIVDVLDSENAVKVVADNGRIMVYGAVENQVVEVYNTAGQVVYRGFGSIVEGLSEGIYIVAVGGRSYKVAL